MPDVVVDYLGEGRVDEVACRRLITFVGGVPGVSFLRPLKGTGKQNVDSRLKGLCARASLGYPVLILRDLDLDAVCAAALVERLGGGRCLDFMLRIAVREFESWLIADAENYADYCGLVRGAKFPSFAESLQDPKAYLLDLALNNRARALSAHLREARMRGVPDWASLGAWNAEFIAERWDVKQAVISGSAPSLARAIRTLAACVLRHAR